MNLDDDNECKILRAQRVICGWKIDIAAKCRQQMHEGRRTLFWITLPAGENATEGYNSINVSHLPTLTRDATLIPIGHISLDREDFPENPDFEPMTSLATPDGSCLTITTLFVRLEATLRWLNMANRRAGATRVPQIRHRDLGNARAGTHDAGPEVRLSKLPCRRHQHAVRETS